MNAATLTPQDKARLSHQCALILARLEQGTASNVELAHLSLKYTSRISDLRDAGYSIDCVRGKNGVNVYVLVPRVPPPPPPVQASLFHH